MNTKNKHSWFLRRWASTGLHLAHTLMAVLRKGGRRGSPKPFVGSATGILEKSPTPLSSNVSPRSPAPSYHPNVSPYNSLSRFSLHSSHILTVTTVFFFAMRLFSGLFPQIRERCRIILPSFFISVLRPSTRKAS